MKYASFFSGIAGFELALDKAGHKRVFSCEIDPFCNKVVKERYGHEHSEKDIRKVKAARIPEADLWVGGFPCQDLSVAGKRGGITEERSGLVWRLLELAKVRQPRYLFLENVPGLLNSKRGGDLALLVRKLAQLGYVGCYRVLDAQYCGVPQRRRRVFVIGHLGAVCPLEVLFEPKGGSRDLAASGKPGEEVAFSLRANPSHSGDKGDGGINTTLVTNDSKSSTPKRPSVSRSETGTGRHYVARSIQASQGHHGHSSPRGDGSDNLVVSSDIAHCVAKSSGGGLGGRDGQDDYVIGSLCAHSKEHGHQMGSQQAAESGQLVAAPITAGSNPNSNAPGRRSEDDVNLVITPMQDVRGTRKKKQNGIGIRPGAPIFTVDSTSRHGVAIPGTMNPWDQQNKRICPSNGKAPTVAGSDGGGGQRLNYVADVTAFQPTGGSRDVSAGKKSPPIKVGSGLGLPSGPAVAFDWTIGGDKKMKRPPSMRVTEESPTLKTQAQPAVATDMMVRRLTPTECERLQGFPDGWTCLCGVRPDCPDRRIPPWVDPSTFTLDGCGHSGCGCKCPDSPRYKALGNAVAVPAVLTVADRFQIL